MSQDGLSPPFSPLLPNEVLLNRTNKWKQDVHYKQFLHFILKKFFFINIKRVDFMYFMENNHTSLSPSVPQSSLLSYFYHYCYLQISLNKRLI